ncbi:unnamed protein product [Linum trigynum]|uniref:Uncharacterized protein n=1 Tax=Linum trigynum TaxID=586398 RepID=A0AAV2CWR8_9ROSI
MASRNDRSSKLEAWVDRVVTELRSKLREIGMLRLIPKMLVLIVVQRQNAASRSTSPSRRLHQGFTGDAPTMTLTRFST